MKRGLNSKGQMELSFGMIFSLILIIVFMGFAGYVVWSFVDLGNQAETGVFVKNLQRDVDKAWKGFQSSETKVYSLPSKITKICFIDTLTNDRGDYRELHRDLFLFAGDEDNMMFYPIEESSEAGTKINHIDVELITQRDNPYCIDVFNGRLEIEIIKERGETLVRLGRVN
jgi:hypothetical protein